MSATKYCRKWAAKALDSEVETALRGMVAAAASEKNAVKRSSLKQQVAILRAELAKRGVAVAS